MELSLLNTIESKVYDLAINNGIKVTPIDIYNNYDNMDNNTIDLEVRVSNINTLKDGLREVNLKIYFTVIKRMNSLYDHVCRQCREVCKYIFRYFCGKEIPIKFKGKAFNLKEMKPAKIRVIYKSKTTVVSEIKLSTNIVLESDEFNEIWKG